MWWNDIIHIAMLYEYYWTANWTRGCSDRILFTSIIHFTALRSAEFWCEHFDRVESIWLNSTTQSGLPTNSQIPYQLPQLQRCHHWTDQLHPPLQSAHHLPPPRCSLHPGTAEGGKKNNRSKGEVTKWRSEQEKRNLTTKVPTKDEDKVMLHTDPVPV